MNFEPAFWESLIYDDLEELLFFYQVDYKWTTYLEQEEVLQFLNDKYKPEKPATTFLELADGKPTINTDLLQRILDEDQDVEEYLAENDLVIDPWTVIQILQRKDLDLLIFLTSLKDYIYFSDFTTALWLFVLGHDGTLEMLDVFVQELLQGPFEEEWGPVAIGIAMGNNVPMFEYLYEDLFSDEYYDTSDYYKEWTLLARDLASRHALMQIRELFDNL